MEEETKQRIITGILFFIFIIFTFFLTIDEMYEIEEENKKCINQGYDAYVEYINNGTRACHKYKNEEEKDKPFVIIEQ